MSSPLPEDELVDSPSADAEAAEESEATDSEVAKPARWWQKVLTGRLRWPVRLAILYVGIGLPIICHLWTTDGPLDEPTWQSGELRDKLAYVLSAACGWPVFPFLGFAMVCLAFVLVQESKLSTHTKRFELQ